MKLIHEDRLTESALSRLSAGYRVPGFSYCIIRDGRAEAARGFGFADAQGRIPVTGKNAFEAASLTKPLFALIVLRLADRGVLRLDDRLCDIAPELAVSEDPRIRSATVRHALSHSTGLVNWGERPRLPLLFGPGSGFSYSGEGYYWLQHIAEKLTSKDFCALMNDELLLPLGMAYSSPVFTPYILSIESRKFDAEGHVLPRRTEADTASSVPEPNAAWSLYSGAEDYARFICEVLSCRGHLSPEMFREMTSPQSRAGDGVMWGLGWGIPEADANVLWHWGDNGGYRSFAALDTVTKDGICIFTNGMNGTALCLDIVKLISGDDYRDSIGKFIDTVE